jgi:hypothetical protein
LGKDFAGLAIVIEIHQEGKLDGVPILDEVFLSDAAGPAGILVPPELLGVRGGTDDVEEAIAVNIDR